MSCQIFENGLEFSDRRAEIVCKDRSKRCYRGMNPDEKLFCRYLVDGGLITTKKQAKCDYLIIGGSEQKAYFIELKGGDITHAAKQIDSTLDELEEDLDGFVLFGRIVLSHTSRIDLRSATIIALRKRLARRSGTLEYKTNEFKETL